jgi:peptidoglycan/LPS O-acetylase OafA/YrhL
MFHSGYGWASGGFLGVSVFFTLSGFLITSLLVDEQQRDGRIALRAFYGRRARRLVPASVVCVALVVAAWPWWTDAQQSRLAGDVVAALGQVANWRAAFAEVSYRDLFGQSAGPLTHFWSLAIEEQLYLVLPLVVGFGLLRGRRCLVAVLGGLALASTAALALTDDFDLAYNGTHTRAAEVLVGAMAAAWWAGRRPSGIPAQVSGGASLVLLGIAVGTVSLGDQWLMRGGFLVVSMLSVLVVVGASTGRLAQVLGWRPLAAVGRRSYGIYLYHWPLWTLLSPARVGLDGVGLACVRLVAVGVVVEVSYRWIEQPIRRRRLLATPRAAGALYAASIGVVIGAVFVLPERPRTSTEVLLAEAAAPVVTFRPVETVEPVRPVEPVEPVETVEPPRRVMVVGDSTSLIVANALDTAADGRIEVIWAGEEGCPFVAVEATRASSELDWVVRECRGPTAELAALLGSFQPDAVVVVAGAMAMMEHRYPGDPEGYLPGSPEYVVRHDAGMLELLEMLGPLGVPVVVADAPPLGIGSYSTFEMADRRRLEAWNAQIRRWDDAHDEVSTWAYADAIIAYEAEYGNIRTDGSHPEFEPLVEIMRATLLDRFDAVLDRVAPIGP